MKRIMLPSYWALRRSVAVLAFVAAYFFLSQHAIAQPVATADVLSGLNPCRFNDADFNRSGLPALERDHSYLAKDPFVKASCSYRSNDGSDFGSLSVTVFTHTETFSEFGNRASAILENPKHTEQIHFRETSALAISGVSPMGDSVYLIYTSGVEFKLSKLDIEPSEQEALRDFAASVILTSA